MEFRSQFMCLKCLQICFLERVESLSVICGGTSSSGFGSGGKSRTG